MAKVLDSVTLPIDNNGTVTDETYVNNPKSIAPQFNASTAYTAGQFVYYEKKLYRFIADHAAGAWNSAHVEEKTIGAEISALKQDLKNNEVILADGNVDIIWDAKYYNGYYDGNDSYTGNGTEGKSAVWGVVLLHVKTGATITISNMAQGGTKSAWLNSTDLTDIKSTFLSANNNGVKTCVTDYLALSVYNGVANYKTYSVLYNAENHLEAEINSVDNKFNYEIGGYNDSSNLYSNNPNDWVYPAWNASLKVDPVVKPINLRYMSMHIPETVPEHLANGVITIAQYDSNDEIIPNTTGYHGFSASDRSVRFFTITEGCTHLKIFFNTGNGSIPVTADDISQLKMYIGPALFTSYSVFPEPVFPEKAIPQQARTLMDGGYLPDYWLNYLRVKKDSLDDLDDTIGNHGFSFAFITDEHWASNYQKSPYILRWLKENTTIDRFVSGGDVLNEHDTIAKAMMYLRDWRDRTNGLMVRNLRGNHDNNSMQSDTSQYLGDDRFYANLIRPVENAVTVRDGNLYYYEKIEAQKVCIFYLDTGDIVTSSLIDFDAQITWMSGIVATLDSDWSILVIQHIVYDGGTQENPNIYTTGQKTITFLNSVTNCNVIGLIGGHTHYDYSDTSNGWPIIITSTDSAQRAETLPATEGTVSEQLFDVFHVDTENSKIYATRIGAGVDREWDY